MKNFALMMLLIGITCVNNSFAQRNYIDLSGCNSTINSDYKTGWSLEFQDAFDGGALKDYANTMSPSECSTFPIEFSVDERKIIKSERQWRWNQGMYSGVGDPYYDELYNINLNESEVVLEYNPATGLEEPVRVDKFIRLKSKYENDGISHFQKMYPVTKYFSSSELSTQFMGGCNEGDVAKPEYNFTYGWIEMRCRLPQGKYIWPAFWLFSSGEVGSDTKTKYREIDFEAGCNDYILLSNHWDCPPGECGFSEPAYALPGQTFSEKWVTYAIKWEPNKIVWYINNTPVRVVKDNDKYLDIISVLIPNKHMYILTGMATNINAFRYNMSDIFNLINSLRFNLKQI